MEVNYKLDLPVKIKIHPVQYIAILELVYREYKPLMYEADTYKGREEDNHEKFFIMDVVVAFSRLEGLGVVCNGVPSIQGIRLFQDGTSGKVAGISD